MEGLNYEFKQFSWKGFILVPTSKYDQFCKLLNCVIKWQTLTIKQVSVLLYGLSL